MRILDEGDAPRTDRRRRLRVQLQYTLFLFHQAGDEPVEARTRNISSDGFYCIAQQPFAIGGLVRCLIQIPSRDYRHPHSGISLSCEAKVLRVDVIAGAAYGIACHIESYSVAPPRPAAIAGT